jgi:hypothetical protein
VLKAVGGEPGRPLIVLGLSEANLRRLRRGNPVPVHTAELGLPGPDVVLLLVWGVTPPQWRMLAGAVTAREGWPRTVVLGMDDDTVGRLRRQPITLDLGDHQPALAGTRLVLFSGPTEEQMEAELAPLLTRARRVGPGRVPGSGPDLPDSRN